MTMEFKTSRTDQAQDLTWELASLMTDSNLSKTKNNISNNHKERKENNKRDFQGWMLKSKWKVVEAWLNKIDIDMIIGLIMILF